MNNARRWFALTLMAITLAACAPAETTLDSPTMAPEAGETVKAVTQPTATPVPALPAVTVSPPPTATLPKLTVDLSPEGPTKPAPVEDSPLPDMATAVAPDDPYALELIDKAMTDLAQYTGLPKEEIVLVDFQYVTWPDASLGCPVPGMAYADVLVDGYFIMLRVYLGIYNYHGASGGKGPFLCEGGKGTKIIVPPPAASLDR